MVANNGSPYYYHKLRTGVDGTRVGCGALLAFFSSRVLRGGPRLLVYVGFVLVGLFLISRSLPSDYTSSIGSYREWWKGADWFNDGSVGGGLRIVVFGENDVTTPVAMGFDSDKLPRTWTEALCEELSCTSHLSFVPAGDSVGRSLTSNEVYSDVLAQMKNETDKVKGKKKPGLDFSFLPEQYPIPTGMPDMAAQVATFLSLPPPQKRPQETLWVFNFGTWDIWSLAALPREIGEDAVDAMIRHIFAQVEVLYKQALSANSIAFSDYYKYVNHTVVEPADKATKDGQEGDNNTPTQGKRLDGVERFRLLIPKLFDISLTPGWQRGRPAPPAPHSKAEQMRNAAYLTRVWNERMGKMMDEWLKTPDPEEEFTDDSGEASDSSGWLHRLGLKKPKHSTKLNDGASGEVEPLVVPYPTRDGAFYDLPAYLNDIIIERQFQVINMTDRNGFGQKPLEKTFLQVWKPCIDVAGIEGLASEASGEEKAAEPPKETAKDAGKGTAKETASKETSKPKEAGGKEPETEASGDKQYERRVDTEAEMSTGGAEVCEDPRNTLFYTHFTLSPRAVEEIGRQVAALMRDDMNLRRRQQEMDKSYPVGKRTAISERRR